jgi:uncharacterized membrane protein YbaN (DUF454 family)
VLQSAGFLFVAGCARITALGVLVNLIPGASRTGLAMARNAELPTWFAHISPARSLPLRVELTVAAVGGHRGTDRLRGVDRCAPALGHRHRGGDVGHRRARAHRDGSVGRTLIAVSSTPTLGRRLVWIPVGLACVGLGGVGLAVPGLPATVFFIAAAAAFSRSSPRLEQWVLNLRGVGPLVRDYRAGLGMPRRAKVIAIATMWTAIVVSAMVIETNAVRLAVVLLGLVGTVVIVRVRGRDD